MGRCRACGFVSDEISEAIGLCVKCLRENPSLSLEAVKRIREEWRKSLNLPLYPPRSGNITCHMCVNECSIPEGDFGYCGIIKNEGGRFSTISGGFNRAYLHWYFDPLPTNCVAAPVCPERENYGFYNLAVFFAGCNLDCLFCQNIHHKYMIKDGKVRTNEGVILSDEELFKIAMDPRVVCVCFFGGDPIPHMAYTIKVARKIIRYSKKGKRVCWETNGLMDTKITENVAKLCAETGGKVKVDWKAYSPTLYQILTGVDGEKAVERLKENVMILSKYGVLVVSTLVVPHYIDAVEIGSIARFLASIDPDIPYILLGFAPQHLMFDIPTTSRKQMEEVYSAALSAGLKNVHIGNRWLLR